MEKEYKLLTRPYWPCLFSSANDEQKIINNLSSTTTSLSPTITNHKTKQMSSPITNDNLNKLLDEQRVYEYRAFSSDIIRTIGKSSCTSLYAPPPTTTFMLPVLDFPHTSFASSKSYDNDISIYDTRMRV